MVHRLQTRVRRGSRILLNNRAIVLHQGGQCGWAGGVHRWLILAQQSRRKTISCKSQVCTHALVFIFYLYYWSHVYIYIYIYTSIYRTIYLYIYTSIHLCIDRSISRSTRGLPTVVCTPRPRIYIFYLSYWSCLSIHIYIYLSSYLSRVNLLTLQWCTLHALIFILYLSFLSYISMHLYIYTHIDLTIYLYIYTSIHLSVHLSISRWAVHALIYILYLSYLSYLSIHLSI